MGFLYWFWWIVDDDLWLRLWRHRSLNTIQCNTVSYVEEAPRWPSAVDGGGCKPSLNQSIFTLKMSARSFLCAWNSSLRSTWWHADMVVFRHFLHSQKPKSKISPRQPLTPPRPHIPTPTPTPTHPSHRRSLLHCRLFFPTVSLRKCCRFWRSWRKHKIKRSGNIIDWKWAYWRNSQGQLLHNEPVGELYQNNGIKKAKGFCLKV